MTQGLLNILLLASLVLVMLIPIILIVIGLVRRNKKNGISFYMFGAFFVAFGIATLLSDPVAHVVTRVLYSFGMVVSFYDTSIISIPLLILFVWLFYRVYSFIRKKFPCVKKEKVSPPSDSGNQKAFYAIENDDGFLVRVSEDDLCSYTGISEERRNAPLNKAEQKLKDMILQDLYGQTDQTHADNVQSDAK